MAVGSDLILTSNFAPSLVASYSIRSPLSPFPIISARTRESPRERREGREEEDCRSLRKERLGMDFMTDKLRSLLQKWQTLIEAHVDVKTTGNYTLRMFGIGFTKRSPNQICRKMREIMVNQATSCDLKDLVQKFIPEVIGKEIEKATTSIYPLQNVFIWKVKILKAPKFDLGKLMEVICTRRWFIFS
ncbi:hypothetical protein COCNU_05G003770 [Cocos nucifera]|uniref:40S ribosomal protein S3a n=1 Tax=Cocos nucifera TaxID=13894 RepID=A0A8K0N1J8_COCNU|nr:hypothetical protein COCNU_05G003770 [Cocos nucifera]